MDSNSRRSFLQALATGGTAVALGPHLAGCGAGDNPDETWENVALGAADMKALPSSFRVEVTGLYGEVPGVIEVDPGRLVISIGEVTGDKPEHLSYAYGAHSYDDFRMTVELTPGTAKLLQWVKQAMSMGGSGRAYRRDANVYVYAANKSTLVRTIKCFGLYPVSFNAGDPSTGSVHTGTLTCKVDRIEVV